MSQEGIQADEPRKQPSNQEDIQVHEPRSHPSSHEGIKVVCQEGTKVAMKALKWCAKKAPK